MKFVPTYKLDIIPDCEFNTRISDVEKKLVECRTTGSFNAFDNTKIYYEFFLSEGNRASIVIVHGLSEFTKKFYEFIYYMLNQGYNLFIYDQRCHGLSGRLTNHRDLLHVDRFDDYVRDLNQFMDEVVIPQTDKPVYLYAHSMGCAVAALYLARYRDKIKKAILSAPMFVPVVEKVSRQVARHSVGIAKALLGKKTKFSLTKEFNPDVSYRAGHGSSRVRFEYNMNLRRENPYYQSTPMSLGWVYNSLTVGAQIFSRKIIDNINAKILVISAENDTMVENEPQILFAKRCKNCEFLEIKGETHALLASNEKTLSTMLQRILAFYN